MSKENFSIILFEKVAKLSLLESFKVISSSLYNSKISGYNEKENCQGVVSKPDLLSTEKSLPIIQKAFPPSRQSRRQYLTKNKSPLRLSLGHEQRFGAEGAETPDISRNSALKAPKRWEGAGGVLLRRVRSEVRKGPKGPIRPIRLKAPTSESKILEHIS